MNYEDTPFLANTSHRLLIAIEKLGGEFGPLSVALVAAFMSDPEAVIASLVHRTIATDRNTQDTHIQKCVNYESRRNADS